jgi:hypothetical protein
MLISNGEAAAHETGNEVPADLSTFIDDEQRAHTPVPSANRCVASACLSA